MMTQFKKIAPKELDKNVFRLFWDDWALLCCGTEESFNCMTVSYGGMGVLWGRHTAFCYVRPQRYTYEFTEQSPLMTLSFFGGSKHDELSILGKKSGREIDKMHFPGLTPRFDIPGCVYYDEAELVICGRKLYGDIFRPENFADDKLYPQSYPAGDTHKMYILDIEQMLVRQ